MDAITGFSFSRPEALLLLLLLVPLTVYLTRTSMALLRPQRRRFSLALRLVVISLLVLALAGLGIVRASDRLSVVFLLDRSDSVPLSTQAAQTAYVSDAMASMRETDAAGAVVFGADALVDRPVSPDKTLPDLRSRPTTTYSNLADALRLGLGILPAATARRLVLLSDGKENVGSAEWAARLAAANGVPIDIVPLGTASGPEVWLEGLSAPSPVREGERVSLQVSVSSSTDTTATLSILMDGAPLTTSGVSLVRGTNSFVQQLPPATRGFHTYAVQVEPPAGSDTRRENNRYSAFSLVLGKPSLLIVEGHEGEAAAFRSALAPSMDADVVAPSSMPANARGLAGYDGIVLVNVPASSLSATAMQGLQLAVRDLGKGLIVVGGDESYAAGGYFRTPLEEMLPVDLNLPSKLDIPSVGMVMVIDRSGSMEMAHGGSVGVKKIELAKEAAAQAVAQLSERDYAGVITFDDAADWVVELQALGDPAMFKSRIGSITSGGGTDIYAGLSPAVDALINSKAKSRHIVLLTDGVSAPGDYEGLLKKMEDNNITLSAVAVGIDADTALMQTLAAGGHGRYYYTEDGNALPQIFAHESHIASRSYLIEHPFTPERSSPSAILEGMGGLPALQGYVGTSPKPGGQIVLVSDAGDPVLAQWQYGLGRVVAWTSDAKGQWAKDWVGWQDFPRFWAQAVRWTTGTQAGGSLQPRVGLQGGTAKITVDASAPDGSYLNNLAAGATVVGPDNITATVTLHQTTAGRYEGSFPATVEGAYLLRVQATGSQAANLSQTLGVVVPYSPEYRGSVTDDGLLGRLASLTSGRTLTLAQGAAAFEHNLDAVKSTSDLWPLLLLLAILLLPFDIGVRRVAVRKADVLTALDTVKRRLGWQPRPQPATASAPNMAALFDAKSRVRTGRADDQQLRPLSDQAAGTIQPQPTIPILGEIAAPDIEAPERKPAPPSAAPATTQSRTEDADSLATRLRRARDQRR
ncbi:MAG: VWA domain-containing protein [Chloroflexota bacterium]